MRELYRKGWVVVRLLRSKWVFAIGAVVILYAHGASGRATEAFPAVIVWFLLAAGAQFVARVLPNPNKDEPFPRVKAMPKATLGVSITPVAPVAACPDVAETVDRLPEHLRALIRR